MAAVLAADAPEEGLLGYPSHSNGAPIDICIKAESTIELLSMTPNDVPNTMHSFNGWVNALIPGFGRCQVQRKSLIYRELKLRPNGLAGVTSLTIEFGEDPDPEALLGLLLLVELQYEELEGIVASCPNLVELAVCTHTIEMRFCLRDSNYRDLTLDSSSHLSFSWDIKEIAEARVTLKIHLRNVHDVCEFEWIKGLCIIPMTKAMLLW
ncbi:hypothetical protein GQ600_25751 [Phytophthora cactorum]|nr:hypothetical protein GQ600_25751 [Phytophthora cactorum]